MSTLFSFLLAGLIVSAFAVTAFMCACSRVGHDIDEDNDDKK